MDYKIKENKHNSNFTIYELEDISLIEVNHKDFILSIDRSK